MLNSAVALRRCVTQTGKSSVGLSIAMVKDAKYNLSDVRVSVRNNDRFATVWDGLSIRSLGTPSFFTAQLQRCRLHFWWFTACLFSSFCIIPFYGASLCAESVLSWDVWEFRIFVKIYTFPPFSFLSFQIRIDRMWRLFLRKEIYLVAQIYNFSLLKSFVK